MEQNRKEEIPDDKILIGRKPVIDALNQGLSLEKVWIEKGLRGDLEKEIRQLTKSLNIPLQYVPKVKLKSLTKMGNHQGVAAMLPWVDYVELGSFLSLREELEGPLRVLVLDGVEDVRNLGALARTAVWFGFHLMIISSKKSARINSFAYKSSAGAIKDIAICRVQNMLAAVEELILAGVQVLVAEGTEQNATDVSYDEPIALVMGSESMGVQKGIKLVADGFISIPGTGKVESLNVSVAGALSMHQIYNSSKV